MLNIVCVLRSGGDYDWEYVYKLRGGIESNISIPHKFMVFTDIPNADNSIMQYSLEKHWEGTWSKIEMFKLVGENLYLDLDTIIVKEMDYLINNARLMYHTALSYDLFLMLKAFRKGEKWASGLMYWQGDYSWLFYNLERHQIDSYGKWEQRYIKDQLYGRQVDIRSIGGDEIKSFKWHCREGVPEGTNIVCFHGKPRPRETYLWDGRYLLVRGIQSV